MFSPSDRKFATCSDDGTVRIWDFVRCYEERILRGHGADVRCVDWHPQKGLIVSGSKDNQQPIKMWDPKTGGCIATLHAHKSTVMDMKWNGNGHWLLTASRDHLLKLFDIRKMSQEVQVFRGHKKEAASLAWHPVHEGLFCSGGSDGAVMFWCVGADKEVGVIEQAHDSIVWSLAWHPMGHILVTGSNDHTSKFWTRNRPGDKMRDKYNLNTLPAGVSSEEELQEQIVEEPKARIQRVIPGMGPDDKLPIGINDDATIPGLDFSVLDEQKLQKKTPYSKPIPRSFQKQWDEVKFKGSNEWSDPKGQQSGDRRFNNQGGNQRFQRGGRGRGGRGNIRHQTNLMPFPNLREPPPTVTERQDVDHRKQKDVDHRDSWNSGRDVDHRHTGYKDADHRFGAGDQDMRQPPPQMNMRNGPGFRGGRDRNRGGSRGDEEWGGEKRRKTEGFGDQDFRFNADQDYRTKPQDTGRYQDSDSRQFRDNRKYNNNSRDFQDKDSRQMNDRDSRPYWNNNEGQQKDNNWGQFNEAPKWRGRGRGSYNNRRPQGRGGY